jgi:hypothetical protein
MIKQKRPMLFPKEGFWLLSANMAHQIHPLLSFFTGTPCSNNAENGKNGKLEPCKSMIYKSKLRVSVFIFLKCLKMIE